MQDITAVGAHIVLQIFGLDVERNGNTLVVYNSLGEQHPLNIAEACSGMRMLMAFLALGVAMAFSGLKRFWQQAVLVLLSVPTAVFVNILRVVTLSLLSLIDSDLAAGGVPYVHWPGLARAGVPDLPRHHVDRAERRC